MEPNEGLTVSGKVQLTVVRDYLKRNIHPLTNGQRTKKQMIAVVSEWLILYLRGVVCLCGSVYVQHVLRGRKAYHSYIYKYVIYNI